MKVLINHYISVTVRYSACDLLCDVINDRPAK